MHSDLVALLALQADDEILHELETRIAAFKPRLEELDRSLRGATQAVEKATVLLDDAEKRERELQNKLEEQKQLHERSLGQLETVRKPKEAAAAMTQAEITSRFLQEIDRELHQVVDRVVEARRQLGEREAELAGLREAQNEQRAAFESEIAAIRTELDAAKKKREAAAESVPRSLLQRYDKIRRKRVRAVFLVQGLSCGNCDTALPLQRRNIMLSSGSIESCEACGVLLYVEE